MSLLIYCFAVRNSERKLVGLAMFRCSADTKVSGGVLEYPSSDRLLGANSFGHHASVWFSVCAW